jgi:hypothetical protein
LTDKAFDPKRIAGTIKYGLTAPVLEATVILNTPEFQAFNRQQMGSDKLSYEEACRIYEALHQEALTLGTISSDNIWDGFEVDLRIAKAVNGIQS